jgi:hypothetical protein
MHGRTFLNRLDFLIDIQYVLYKAHKQSKIIIHTIFGKKTSLLHFTYTECQQNRANNIYNHYYKRIKQII